MCTSPILMHTDIDEGAELPRRLVTVPFEDHRPGFEILSASRHPSLNTAALKARAAESRPGLFQLVQNVGHSRQTKSVIDEGSAA